MILFIAFALFLSIAVASLIIWPLMKHPTLPPKQKRRLSLIAFVVLVPLGLLLYAWVGVPQMGAL
jgi:hypothetical protein